MQQFFRHGLFRSGALIFLTVCSIGCKQTDILVDDSKSRGVVAREKYFEIDTYYATNRDLIKDNIVPYGTEISDIKYGKCVVSIPFSHQKGELELPSLWRMEWAENPEKHVVIQDILPMKGKEYFRQLKADQSNLAFVYIHGFNVNFEFAAYRAAQIAFDMQFAGLPIFYTWPSLSSPTGYWKDKKNIMASVDHIVTFIKDLEKALPDHDLILIAHSMGNVGLTNALVKLFEEKKEYSNNIKEIILTAPDIDAQVFKNEIAPKITQYGNNVTMYASSNDLALKASLKVNGKPRAGDSGDGILIVDGIETIDATNVITDYTGHAYFGDSNPVIHDMDLIIEENKRANDRSGLIRKITAAGVFWIFENEN